MFAGWLIALMIWLLPSARSARLFVIVLLTYVVALGHFSHVIAGSVEAAYAVFVGRASLPDYALGFFAPTILGNTIGGVALVALLNHAPLAPDVQDDLASPDRRPSGWPGLPRVEAKIGDMAEEAALRHAAARLVLQRLRERAADAPGGGDGVLAAVYEGEKVARVLHPDVAVARRGGPQEARFERERRQAPRSQGSWTKAATAASARACSGSIPSVATLVVQSSPSKAASTAPGFRRRNVGERLLRRSAGREPGRGSDLPPIGEGPEGILPATCPEAFGARARR